LARGVQKETQVCPGDQCGLFFGARRICGNQTEVVYETVPNSNMGWIDRSPCGGVSIGLSALKAAAPDDNVTHVSQLLSEAKTQAFQLNEDAGMMESFTYSELGWESHAAAITKIKDDVNAMGRTLTKLDEARTTALPWQKTPIDQITPLLKEMTLNTTAVIEHLNKNPRDLRAEAYKDYLEANADGASHLASLIGDFVDYGKTKERLENLTHRLELEPATK